MLAFRTALHDAFFTTKLTVKDTGVVITRTLLRYPHANQTLNKCLHAYAEGTVNNGGSCHFSLISVALGYISQSVIEGSLNFKRHDLSHSD